MSINIAGNQTTLNITWDEITLILVTTIVCLSWVVTSYYKYSNKQSRQ